jgi:hypothetical protein
MTDDKYPLDRVWQILSTGFNKTQTGSSQASGYNPEGGSPTIAMGQTPKGCRPMVCAHKPLNHNVVQLFRSVKIEPRCGSGICLNSPWVGTPSGFDPWLLSVNPLRGYNQKLIGNSFV